MVQCVHRLHSSVTFVVQARSNTAALMPLCCRHALPRLCQLSWGRHCAV